MSKIPQLQNDINFNLSNWCRNYVYQDLPTTWMTFFRFFPGCFSAWEAWGICAVLAGLVENYLHDGLWESPFSQIPYMNKPTLDLWQSTGVAFFDSRDVRSCLGNPNPQTMATAATPATAATAVLDAWHRSSWLNAMSPNPAQLRAYNHWTQTIANEYMRLGHIFGCGWTNTYECIQWHAHAYVSACMCDVMKCHA